MRCVFCGHGETQAGKTTVVLYRGNTVVAIKRLPAETCENCGEYYLSEDITKNVLNSAKAPRPIIIDQHLCKVRTVPACSKNKRDD